MIQIGLNLLGLSIAAGTLAAIVWSIAHPSRRIWPPDRYTALTPIFVWVPTLTLFGILIVLGLMGWGDFPISDWVRFGIGLPLILIGNVAVWTEVFYFGIPLTSGAVGDLRTDGLYRYSRNPQYITDIAILTGWALLSASLIALPASVGGIIVLLVAPLAEEKWLETQYGEAYRKYKTTVRRYF